MKKFDYEWASKQPFIELLVAAGLGSRKTLRQGKTFVAWDKQDQNNFTQYKEKYGIYWISQLCEEAYSFSDWTIIKLDQPIPYDRGILTIKKGKTLLRIMLE